jgi:hypothetical protein
VQVISSEDKKNAYKALIEKLKEWDTLEDLVIKWEII